MHVAESRKVSSTEFQLSPFGGMIDSTPFPATMCDNIGRGLPNQGGTREPWFPEVFEVLLFKRN